MLNFLLNLFRSKKDRWNSGVNPNELRELIPPSLQTPRKLRLYGIACCDRIAHLIVHPDSKASVELGLRLADGLIDHELQTTVEDSACAALSLMVGVSFLADGDDEELREMEIPIETAQQWLSTIQTLGVPIEAVPHAAEAATHPSESDAPFGAGAAMTAAWAAAAASDQTSEDAEMLAQCALLRDIFGNPFDRAPVDLEAASAESIAIATRMYEQNDFSLMPQLKTSLQESGCSDPRVLSHCNDPIHVRGCWLVDRILQHK